MTFLAPVFLSLAVLAGVPLLVHLLRRRVTRPVAFPAVRFLQQSEREQDRERLVRNRLLLLLRLVAVLALVAAVARPVANIGGAGHPPIAVALVLDQSMSTAAIVDGRPLFARLQDAARAVLADLAEADQGWLVTSHGTVVAGDAATLRSVIDGLAPVPSRGDLAGALRRAQGLVAAGAPRTPVLVVLSDGQRSALPERPAPLRLGTTALVVHVPGVPPPPNHGVLDVRVDPVRWAPAGRLEARIAASAPAPWRVLLGERTLARGSAAPRADSPGGAADGAVRLAVEAVAADTGWLAGRVELDPDDFPGDDVRHFVVRAAPATPVAAGPGAGAFVRAALEALVEDGRLRRSAGAERAAVQVVAATEAARPPAVRLAPGDPLQVVAANRTLERAGIPWRFGAPLRDVVPVRPASGGARASRGDDGEPAAIATGRDAGSADATAAPASLAGATVTLRYRLTRVPDAAGADGAPDSGRIVLEAGGTPWLVVGRAYALVASPLEPAATDAPLRGDFVPWLRDLVSRDLGDDGLVLAAAPGDTLALPGPIDSLVTPAGRSEPSDGAVLVAPPEVGVHRLRRLGRTVGVLVVNPEAEESGFIGWGDSVWRASWIEGARQVEPAPDRLASAVYDRAGGRSITWPLVLAALLALVAEAIVSRGWFATAPEAARAAGAAS